VTDTGRGKEEAGYGSCIRLGSTIRIVHAPVDSFYLRANDLAVVERVIPVATVVVGDVPNAVTWLAEARGVIAERAGVTELGKLMGDLSPAIGINRMEIRIL
jgi:hypothetical protein